jgi:hypothetical protein
MSEVERPKKIWTLDEVEALIKQNRGYCPCCGHKLAIYKYRANKSLAVMLRKIADRVKQTEKQQVNLDDIPMVYSLHTQQTKLRLHGLIAKYKENGQHVASTWVITTKGYDWLAGRPIQSVVLVFDNQVLGHEGGDITIHQAIGDNEPADTFGQKTITPAEAETLRDIHDAPKRHMAVEAIYRGYAGRAGTEILRGRQYTLKIEKLQVGKPVKIVDPVERTYISVAAFQKDWLIVE